METAAKTTKTENSTNIQHKNSLYTLAFWIEPGKDENEIPQEAYDNFRKKLESAGGSIVSETNLHKKRLAYTVKHLTEAYFGTIEALMPAKATENLYQATKHDSEILRLNIFKSAGPKHISERLKRRAARIAAGKKIKAVSANPTEYADIKTEAATPKEEKKDVDVAELDKKLEELLKS